MKALMVATVFGCVLTAGVAVAQQPPVQQAPPVVQQAPPVQQPPVQAPPVQQPPPAAPAAQAAPPPAPKFPEGSKFAFVNIQRIASESAEGRTASARIQAVQQQKTNQLNDKNKQIEALQAKQRSSVLAADAQAQIQKDIDKLQVDVQRMTQDAQAELQDLQNELQLEFQRKVAPIVEGVAKERGIQMLFSQTDSGLIWSDPGLDLTLDVIRRFDAAMATSLKQPAPIKK